MAASRRSAAVAVRRRPSPLDEARAAFERGEHALALDLLAEAQLVRRDERAAAALLRARVLLAMNKPSEVPATLKGVESNAAAPSAERAMLLGSAFARTGRRAQSDTMFAQAAAAARRGASYLLPEIAYYRALCRWSAYELDDAEAVIEEGMQTAAGAVAARLRQLLGWIDVRRENYAAAARSFVDAIELLDASSTEDAVGRAHALHGLAFIAAETVDLRLGRTVRRTFDRTAWSDALHAERAVVEAYLAWLSLLEGNVERAWDERQRVLTLTTDTSRHAGALIEAGGISTYVGDHFAARRYVGLAASLLLRGDQLDLDLEQRVSMLEYVAAAGADVESARKILALYERTTPRSEALLAFEGDRRIRALERYARGRLLIAEGSVREGVALLDEALDLWTRLGYRLRAAIAANALRWATAERRYAELALDALRNAPKAWLRSALAVSVTDDDPIAQLTPAERRVLAELCKGKRSREIADAFGRSFNTINNQTRAVFSAFGVRSRAALVAKCARLGILGAIETPS